MNNIIYDDEIIIPENDKYQYYYSFIEKLNKIDCVKFALFCAKIDSQNTKESNDCIELVEKWLKDEKSVSSQDLYNAANDAANVSNAIDTSLSAATYAAYTAWTAYYNNIDFEDPQFYYLYTAYALNAIPKYYIDSTLYLKTLLRTTKQYNTKIHNNQHYEFILKEIIKEDIDKVTDTDYNMLIDLSQEYYNINPNITNKRIFIELLRREYE